MNISGIIKLINETKEYGSNGFKKRELVVTTQEQYPQNILVEFIQDRCEICLLYTSPSPRDLWISRMPSSA